MNCRRRYFDIQSNAMLAFLCARCECGGCCMSPVWMNLYVCSGLRLVITVAASKMQSPELAGNIQSVCAQFVPAVFRAGSYDIFG